MSVRMCVYDPPVPGAPHLAVVLEIDGEGKTDVLLVEPWASLEAAEAALVRLGDMFATARERSARV
jgi:hypothetical protein